MKGLGFRVSENKGYRILGPYNKDPILGNSHIYYQYGSRRPKKTLLTMVLADLIP